MTIIPPEGFRRRAGEWLAIVVSIVSIGVSLAALGGGLYTLGRWTALYDTRLAALEKYQVSHEVDIKERTAQRTTELTMLRTTQDNIEKTQQNTTVTMDRLQSSDQYMAAQATQFAATLERVVNTLNQVVTQQAITQSQLDSLKEDLRSKGKL